MFILILAALLHPVHETVSEVDWNSKSRHLEVALRLDVLDEQWLKKKLVGGEKIEKWALPYLQQRFRIAETPAKGQSDPCVYRWVGRKEEGSHVWWFFEIKPSDGARPAWIDQRVFFERKENFTNRVLILEQRRSLVLTDKRPRAKFDASPDRSTDSHEPSFPAKTSAER